MRLMMSLKWCSDDLLMNIYSNDFLLSSLRYKGTMYLWMVSLSDSLYLYTSFLNADDFMSSFEYSYFCCFRSLLSCSYYLYLSDIIEWALFRSFLSFFDYY